jgi:hypothetical protein
MHALGPPDQSENICSFEIYPQTAGKGVPIVLGMIPFICYFKFSSYMLQIPAISN